MSDPWQARDWWQIVIRDASALSGQSLASLLRLLSRRLPVRYLVIDDVEGAGETISRLREADGPITIAFSDLLEITQGITQFDWGDFFLFEHLEDAASITISAHAREYVSRALATVRAVDDTYFYVYSRDQELADVLSREYSGAEVKGGALADLEFPY